MNRYLPLLILTALCAFLCLVPSSRPAPPAQVPEKTIAALIKQLGDEDFDKRQEASKALEAIGVRALHPLTRAAKDDDLEIASRARRLVEKIEQNLDLFLAEYKSYGLPLPPPDAKLVRFQSGWSNNPSGFMVVDPPFACYSLGFLLRTGKKADPSHIFVGMEECTFPSTYPVDIVEPKPELLKRDFRNSGIRFYNRDMHLEGHTGLTFALQCQDRGWHDLARTAWTETLDNYNRWRANNQCPGLSKASVVAHLAWVYSTNEAVQPNSDRWKTFKRMQRILAEEPTLDNAENRRLLKSLELALVPSKAKPDSVEGMIDDLVDTCQETRGFPSLFEGNLIYGRLGPKGFAAVPDLIQHLDDERLTRCVRVSSMHVFGFLPLPPEHVCVKHIVSMMLVELAGKDRSQDWIKRKNDYVVDKAVVQAWWDKACKEGEEAYLLNHVIPAEESYFSNNLMLEIIKRLSHKPVAARFQRAGKNKHQRQNDISDAATVR